MQSGGGAVKVPVNFFVPGTSTGASFNFGILLENFGRRELLRSERNESFDARGRWPRRLAILAAAPALLHAEQLHPV